MKHWLCLVLRDHDKARKGADGRIQTDIAGLSFRPQRVTGRKSALPDIDLRVLVDPGKSRKPSAVVIVPVTDDHRIHFRKRNAQQGGIPDQQIALACVHKDLVLFCLNV